MQQTVNPENFKVTWFKQSANLLMADIIGMAAEGAIITNIHKFDQAFPVISTAIVNTLNVPMYYFQRPIEKALKLTKNFEGKNYYEQRLKKSDAERVETLSKATYHYGLALAAGWATMWGASHAISHITHSPGIHSRMFMTDAVIHMGLIGLMALPAMATPTQRLKDTVHFVAKGFGLDESRAEDLARVSVFSFLPNYATLAAVSTMMYRDAKMKSLYDRLNTSTASSLLTRH